jgi:hypothetical protein
LRMCLIYWRAGRDETENCYLIEATKNPITQSPVPSPASGPLGTDP